LVFRGPWVGGTPADVGIADLDEPALHLVDSSQFGAPMAASVQVTYPGVYVQEIPSGNITITGVATSITAFVGRTIMGPMEPMDCFSFAEFERYFGGRAHGYPLGYAVEDFFQNGGTHAVIVRVFARTDKDTSGVASAALPIGDSGTKLQLIAASPGSWGKNIVASIDNFGITPDVANRFNRYGLGKDAEPAKLPPPGGATTTTTTTAVAPTDPLKDAQAKLAKATAAKNDFDVAAKAVNDADDAHKAAAEQQLETLMQSQQASDPDAKVKAADDAYITKRNESNADPGNQAKKTEAQQRLTDAVAARATALAATDAAATTATTQDKIKDFFNLTLTYTRPDGQKVFERFQGVTAVNSPTAPNRIDRVLAAQSSLARVADDQQLVPVAATDRAPKLTLTKDANGKVQPDKPVAFDTGGDDGRTDLTTEDLKGDQNQRTGIYALDHVDIFNLLCIPPDPADAEYGDLETLYQAAAEYCHKRRAMLIIDPPAGWQGSAQQGLFDKIQPTDLGINGPELEARNCAVYFPRIKKRDPETGQIGVFPACGALAGVYATTDATRGVWKAPAGITAGIGGITGLEFNLTDDQNGMLNPLGINCLRSFPIIGPVVWGARTLRGADLLSDDYKYVPVRRLTLYIEESLYRGTKFAVFEPNDETLWSQLRLSIGAFMADLARLGAFYGYAVACDKTTTTQYDIDRGIVNVRVAFAPVKPAEFIVLQIQQQAGQTP
jgi:phage tail sheath protein FI